MGDENVQSDWWMAPAIYSVLIWLVLLPSAALSSLLETGLFAIITGLAALLLIPFGFVSLFAYYFDAQDIRAAGREWRPLWPLYIIGHLLVGPVAAPVYLFQRGKHVGNDWGRLGERTKVSWISSRVKKVA
jgi:membrane protease YdiL (CAAX protease family)